MSSVQVLSLASIRALFNLRSLYLITYGWLLGMSIWVTFIGGTIALRTLPRHQFGTLQHRTFPIYFMISIAMSSGLLALWSRAHPTVLTEITNPALADVAQAYALGTVTIMHLINHFVVGPLTSKTMFQRHKQEKEEGKAYNEPGISDAMKSLNSTFSMLHGVSSFANLFALMALLFHGLWLGNFGSGL
ncbi:uncharacterized protein LAESUDRAFT_726152 [Laetiporus sulphureus 93-53]|uniref:TMEM205-like domain-containing protein n=1 Tax=Laetiporus sulphureus 93-53 TaxID=1314785 RepID=A0A165E6E2_9APHY|nr:uncharacterized protein LAESUDRAFT_726152 [Laetiporus sulphureus 93-53]KZT06323.1 hypothetical protein LAESUDRAFT_726152 [Laetiporus sulphureus 93-53]